nr:leucine zipper putative tumor suppressor 2-like [Ipomoea batatas]
MDDSGAAGCWRWGVVATCGGGWKLEVKVEEVAMAMASCVSLANLLAPIGDSTVENFIGLDFTLKHSPTVSNIQNNDPGCPWPLRPKKSRSLDDAAVKISAEEYEYEIFRSPEEYRKANLEPPRYDLPQKYTPQRAAVTVAVRPPPPESGSQGAMRSFPVSARPPAPAKKISLGSRKVGSARSADPSTEAPSTEALVPAGLPLTATHASDPSGGHGETRAAKHGKGKEKEVEVEEVAPAKRTRRDGSGSTTPMAHSVTDLFARAKDGDELHRREVTPLKKSLAKRDQRIKELEGKLKTAEETGRRILERADLGEKILTDPVLLARHICRGRETGEAVLAAISRTPIGEDLMYEFGTWASTAGGGPCRMTSRPP